MKDPGIYGCGPEAIRISPEGVPAVVDARAFLGDRVELRLRIGDQLLRAWMPSEGAPRVGEAVSVVLDRARVATRGGTE